MSDIQTYLSTNNEYNNSNTLIDKIQVNPASQELQYTLTLKNNKTGEEFSESTKWLDFKVAGQRIEIQQRFPFPAKFCGGGIEQLSFVKNLKTGENDKIQMEKWKKAGEVKMKGMKEIYLREKQYPVLELQSS